jgi:hypothetical protein
MALNRSREMTCWLRRTEAVLAALSVDFLDIEFGV